MSDVSVITLLLRVVVSLGVVLGVMWGAAKLLGQGGLSRGFKPRNAPVEVVARHSVGRRASVTLVRTGGRGLILGVTDQTVTVLAEIDPDALVVEAPEEAPRMVPLGGVNAPAVPAWKAALDALRAKTVRRA